MSATPEPSVQPISFSRSGAGSSSRCRSRAPRTGPPEPLPVMGPRVQRDHGRARPHRSARRLRARGIAGPEPRTGVSSKSRTPRSSSTRRIPRASRPDAPWLPPCGTRRRGTPVRNPSRSSSADRTWKCSLTPSRSAAITRPPSGRTAPRMPRRRTRRRRGTRRRSPSSLAKRPMAFTLSSPVSQSATAARSPK